MERIEQLGGKIQRDWNDVFDPVVSIGEDKPAVVRTELDPTHARLYIQFIGNQALRDENLRELAEIEGLEALDLRYTLITNEGLRSVSQLSTLKALLLDGTPITDSGLSVLKGLVNLEELHVDNVADISSAGLKTLRGMNKLRYIHAYGTRVSEKDLETIAGALPHCRIDLTTVTHRPMGQKVRLYLDNAR